MHSALSTRPVGKFASKILCTLPFIAVACHAHSQESQNNEIFQSPKIKEIVQPRFPSFERQRGSDGWVVINYMVDTKGKAFEPTVIAAEGHERFQEAALNSIVNSEFEPATIDGKPVEGSNVIRYDFILPKTGRATRSFAKRYRKLVRILSENDEGVALEQIEKIRKKGLLNNYERALFNFALSEFESKFGSTRRQMELLSEALQYESIYDNGTEFLPDEILLIARQQLFALQVNQRFYAEAVRTYRLLKRKYGEDVDANFDRAYSQILSLREGDSSYGLEIGLDENGYFSMFLHKQGFSLENVQGVINEIKLRCDAKYVFFAYDTGKQYEIPESWGECSIQVLGEGNGKFELVQF